MQLPKIETNDDVFALVFIGILIWMLVDGVSSHPLSAAVIAAGVVMLIGAWCAWPLTIALALIGALIGGAGGAWVGAAIAAIVGLMGLLVILLHRRAH